MLRELQASLNREAFLLLAREVLDLFGNRDECSKHVINPTSCICRDGQRPP